MQLTFHSIVAALRSAKLYLVALFLFLYSFAPGFGTPLYYFMTDELKFSQSYIGILGSIASAGWIAGALCTEGLAEDEFEGAVCISASSSGRRRPPRFSRSRPRHRGHREFRKWRSADGRHHRHAMLRRNDRPSGAEGFAFAGLMSIMNLAN